MEATPLLFRVCQVKGSTRADVVNVPAVDGPVVPGHAGLELCLQVSTYLIYGATNQLKGRSRPIAMLDGLPHSMA